MKATYIAETEVVLPASGKTWLRLWGEGQVFTGDGVLVASGRFSGQKVRLDVEDETLCFVPDAQCFMTADIPSLRQLEPGWIDDGSFTDLSPKPPGQIPYEIQVVINAMNRNAIVREQAMLRALGHRTNG